MILCFDFINFISSVCCFCFLLDFLFSIFAHPAFFPLFSLLSLFDSLQMKTNTEWDGKTEEEKKSANHIKYFAMKNSSVAECAPADPHRF